MPRRHKRAFSYHAGVTLDGTQLTCDAAGFATDLVFLSHAKALAPGSSFGLSPRRAGRRQLLATEGTLVLLGAAGERLRARTLPAGFGRAFNLGGLRLALVPAGYLPGAASLLCEAGGRRLLYAGTICRERAFASLGPAEVRCADAVCLDATFGDPRFVLPPRAEAEAALRRFVESALAARRAPVLLVSPFGPAPATLEALLAAGIAVRAHGTIVGALARFARAGARRERPSTGSVRVRDGWRARSRLPPGTAGWNGTSGRIRSRRIAARPTTPRRPGQGPGSNPSNNRRRKDTAARGVPRLRRTPRGRTACSTRPDRRAAARNRAP